MRDLSELTTAVRNQSSREQFREAVSAYHAGALRSSIVSVWIAVVVDLTDKARNFADGGDAAAKAQVAALDRAIAIQDVRGVQNFESGLLKEARDTHQFITHREFEELQRLYHDRNLCAHPAFVESDKLFQPSAEQVRAHLATAVDAVLSQAPIPGKLTIDRFFDEIHAESWPKPPLQSHVEERFMERAKPSIQRKIAQIVVKGCIEPPDGSRKQARRCYEVVTALDSTRPGLLSDTIADVLNKRDAGVGFQDEQLLHVIGCLGRFPITWSTMSQSLTARCNQILGTATDDLLTDERTFYSGPPLHPELQKTYTRRLQLLDATNLARAANEQPHPQFIDPALIHLKNAASFRGAEQRFDAILTLSEYFEVHHIELLRQAIMSNSQVSNAHEIPNDLYNLYSQVRSEVRVAVEWEALANDLRESADDPADHYAFPAFCAAVLGDGSGGDTGA